MTDRPLPLNMAIHHRPATSRRQRGSTLVGIVVGFVLGLAVAAAIAYVLTKTPNPFDGKAGRSEIVRPHLSSVEREPAAPTDKPRFDFSKILPGTEERKSAQREESTARSGEKAAAAPDAPAPATAKIEKAEKADKAEPAEKSGKFFLQAGAYQNAADAEDQRAQLALMGVEAVLQTVTIPDKGTINRVRLGPYATADEMNQVKAQLLKQGVATAVIKNP